MSGSRALTIFALMALTVKMNGLVKDKIKYDYDCVNENQEECLQNDITLFGSQIVTINLDDNCALSKYENEGVFVQTGDIVIVAGKQYALAG